MKHISFQLALQLCRLWLSACFLNKATTQTFAKDENNFNPLTFQADQPIIPTQIQAQQALANPMMYPFMQGAGSYGSFPNGFYPQGGNPVIPYMMMPSYNPVLAQQQMAQQQMAQQQMVQQQLAQQQMAQQQMAQQQMAQQQIAQQQIMTQQNPFSPQQDFRFQGISPQGNIEATGKGDDQKTERKKKFLENKLSEAINQLEALTEEAKHIYDNKDEILEKRAHEDVKQGAALTFPAGAEPAPRRREEPESPSFLEIGANHYPTKMETSENERNNLSILNQIMEKLQIFQSINEK